MQLWSCSCTLSDFNETEKECKSDLVKKLICSEKVCNYDLVVVPWVILKKLICSEKVCNYEKYSPQPTPCRHKEDKKLWKSFFNILITPPLSFWRYVQFFIRRDSFLVWNWEADWSRCSHANDNLSLKDREIKSLRRQVESVSEDLQEASRGRDIAMQENRRLQDDLSVMTKENHVRACASQTCRLFFSPLPLYVSVTRKRGK